LAADVTLEHWVLLMRLGAVASAGAWTQDHCVCVCLCVFVCVERICTGLQHPALMGSSDCAFALCPPMLTPHLHPPPQPASLPPGWWSCSLRSRWPSCRAVWTAWQQCSWLS